MGQASSRSRDAAGSRAPSPSPHRTLSPPPPPPPAPPGSRLSPFFTLPLRSPHLHDARAGASDAGSSGPGATAPPTPLARRPSRLSRARSSLTSLPHLFHRRSDPAEPYADESTPSSRRSPSGLPRPPSASPAHDRGPFLPRLQVPELDIHFDDLSDGPAPGPSHTHLPRPNPARRDGRAASMVSPSRPDRSLRSMTSSLRRRPSPLRRDEDQAALLSRLLSVAAAATAASLMGDDHRAVSEARSVAADGEDGTFDSFLQALQNGRIASALRQSGNGPDEGADSPGASPAPLNFFRMFRFGASAGGQGGDTGPGSGASRPGSPSNQNGDGEDGDGRMVPIIIVGIRSINPSTAALDDHIPPFLDALSSFPTPLTSPGDNTIDGMPRQPQQRFSHRRRASMGGTNTFPSNYDSQRHYRGPERARPWSSFGDFPGPLPPPTTPASSGLSAVSSGVNTPSPSPPSLPTTTQSAAPSRRGSFIRRALEPTAEEPPAQPRVPRQRRMSESDFTRFGSGASRRNGVVEPDHNPGEGSRSWIIYVLGGSYPENHPILTTPSLFTDSPTYEDMLLLSTLLGPAKPPVASEEDVAAAPGLFQIRQVSGTLIAEAVEGDETIRLASDAQCLVCLCDFEVEEEARRLVNCEHLFHRVCIDQWLTTGRNSCPLCRSQGVDEKAASPQSDTPPSPHVVG